MHLPLIVRNKWMMMMSTTTTTPQSEEASQVIVDINNAGYGYNVKHFLRTIYLRFVGRQSILATLIVDSCDL